MKSTTVYIYVMTNDTGFAPCIDNDWLTLACCKGGKKNGGMRTSAAKECATGNTVYILGLCGIGLAKKTYMQYCPVYLAKIDKVFPMIEYFAGKGLSENRKDDVYMVINGELEHKGEGFHHWDSEDAQKKDIGGKFVLSSHQFIYLGNKCGESGLEIGEAFPEIIEDIKRRPRGYRVRRDFNEFEEAVKDWNWFPKDSNHCKIFSNYSINENQVNRRGKCK